jgi:2,4-dienoyl-CoA reductase (NADPH2)
VVSSQPMLALFHPSIDAVATIATSVPRGAFSFVTKKLRDEKVVSVPLCATNRINAPSTVESILANGSADLISMARPFLADPDIVRKSREGRDQEINTCIACNQGMRACVISRRSNLEYSSFCLFHS